MFSKKSNFVLVFEIDKTAELAMAINKRLSITVKIKIKTTNSTRIKHEIIKFTINSYGPSCHLINKRKTKTIKTSNEGVKTRLKINLSYQIRKILAAFSNILPILEEIFFN